VIQEGSPARGAEEFRAKRLRIAQAPRAYRHAGDLMQSFAADAALIRENQGKNPGGTEFAKAANSPPRGAEHTFRR
jgi:hypothetical protein